MDMYLRVALRLIGAVLGILLLLAFIIPLMLIFLVLFFLQKFFHIRIRKHNWMPPIFGKLDFRRLKDWANFDNDEDDDIIDAEVIEVPEDCEK